LRRQKYKNRSPLIITFSIIIGLLFVYYSNYFEKIAPTIIINNSIDWNLKSNINLKAKDNIGIKHYKVTLQSPSTQIVLAEKELNNLAKNINIQVSPPAIINHNDKKLHLIISVTDTSLWGFFRGNTTLKDVLVTVDTTPPVINTITQSKSIKRGSSGVVIFKVTDKNLKNVYIDTTKHRFYPSKFYKDNYYISLIGWDLKNDNFKVMVVATDQASNITKRILNIYQSLFS
jgi:hypothetical protein